MSLQKFITLDGLEFGKESLDFINEPSYWMHRGEWLVRYRVIQPEGVCRIVRLSDVSHSCMHTVLWWTRGASLNRVRALREEAKLLPANAVLALPNMGGTLIESAPAEVHEALTLFEIGLAY